MARREDHVLPHGANPQNLETSPAPSFEQVVLFSGSAIGVIIGVNMKPLEALKAFFRPAETTLALPDSPFVVIDREKTIEKLRLDSRAKESGSNEQPPSNETSLDSVEAEILAEISEHLNRAQIEADNNLKVYAQRLAELVLLRELSSVNGASETARGDYKAAVIGWKNRLANVADKIRESYDELATFKAEHSLRRPAHDVPTPIYTWSTIFVSGIIEALGNTAFLRVNDSLGLVGGLVAATVVAGVNVGVSAFVGRTVWPYLFHKDLWRKLLAWIGSFGWVLFVLGWNLLAAHFRDAKASGLESPEVQAISLLWENTFDLSSIYSYGMLLLGAIFAIISAAAGFKMDDPYPGYGAIYRRHEDRCEDYASQIEEALGQLQSIRDMRIGLLQNVRDQLRMQFSERGQIIEARKALIGRFDAHQDYLETVANSLLEHYRAANRAARTSPTPQHFSKRWHLSKGSLPPLAEIPSIEAEVEAAQAGLALAIQTISTTYSEVIEGFDSLEAIKRSLANGN